MNRFKLALPSLVALLIFGLTGCSTQDLQAMQSSFQQPYRQAYSPGLQSSQRLPYLQSLASQRNFNPYLYGKEYGDSHYRRIYKTRSPDTYLSDVAEGHCCPRGFYRDRVGGCRRIPR